MEKEEVDFGLKNDEMPDESRRGFIKKSLLTSGFTVAAMIAENPVKDFINSFLDSKEKPDDSPADFLKNKSPNLNSNGLNKKPIFENNLSSSPNSLDNLFAPSEAEAGESLASRKREIKRTVNDFRSWISKTDFYKKFYYDNGVAEKVEHRLLEYIKFHLDFFKDLGMNPSLYYTYDPCDGVKKSLFFLADALDAWGNSQTKKRSPQNKTMNELNRVINEFKNFTIPRK